MTLPIPVLTLESPISRAGRKNKDGSMVMIIELTAFESLYSVKSATKIVLFESDEDDPIDELLFMVFTAAPCWARNQSPFQRFEDGFTRGRVPFRKRGGI